MLTRRAITAALRTLLVAALLAITAALRTLLVAALLAITTAAVARVSATITATLRLIIAAALRLVWTRLRLLLIRRGASRTSRCDRPLRVQTVGANHPLRVFGLKNLSAF